MKFKFGEYVGMSRLFEFDKDSVVAHVSLPMPNDWDHEDKRKLSLEECQVKFADRLAKNWRKRPAIIDSHRYDEDDEFRGVSPHPIRPFAELARIKGCCVIPAIPVEPSGALTVAVREIVNRNQSGVVIKIGLADLEDANLKRKIDTVLGGIGVSANDAMICVELGDLLIENVEDVADTLVAQLASIPYLEQWVHAYISIGSFSANIGKIKFETCKEVERSDWLLYKSINKRTDLPRRFLYSDFGIENPNFSRAPLKARASAHLRITLSLEWIVSKGQSIRKLGFRAIQPAAAAIVALDDYQGPDFSFGDEYIKKIAEGQAIGNPSYWRAAGVCHHITLVLTELRQLFGIPGRRQDVAPELQDSLFPDSVV